MDDQTPQSKSAGNGQVKVALAVIGLLVIAFVGYTVYQSQNKTTSDVPAMTAPTSQQIEESPTAAMEQSAYKNGTYTAVGNYTSPGGQEELGVTLTIADGVVTDSQIDVKATRPISKTRQEDFAANYKDLVVGKNIDELELGKVSGSSLSPKGFNDAVAKIKTEAQS